MKKRLFGRDEDGRAVEEVVLESADAAVAILSYGCVVRDWRVDGAGRQPADGAGLPAARGLPAPFPLARGASSGGSPTGPRARASTLDGQDLRS